MIVGILGPGGCGGTFLDWSIQYLSGQEENLVVRLDAERNNVKGTLTQNIVENPLMDSTAHAHQKTHPNGQSLSDIIEIFSADDHQLSTFYYVEDMKPGQTHTSHNNIVKTYPAVKFISYNFTLAHIDLIFWLQYEKINWVEQRYNQIGSLTGNQTPGEIREIISLFYPKCVKGQTLNEQLVDSENLYLINFDDVWARLDTVIFDIFDFLELTIDKTRYLHWVDMYRAWLEKNKTDFFDDLPTILDCIVTGKSLDLGHYNMTFAKEVVLASKLLYNYNLALKFGEADDLRTNTLQWHSILEENVYHNLGDMNR